MGKKNKGLRQRQLNAPASFITNSSDPFMFLNGVSPELVPCPEIEYTRPPRSAIVIVYPFPVRASSPVRLHTRFYIPLFTLSACFGSLIWIHYSNLYLCESFVRFKMHCTVIWCYSFDNCNMLAVFSVLFVPFPFHHWLRLRVHRPQLIPIASGERTAHTLVSVCLPASPTLLWLASRSWTWLSSITAAPTSQYPCATTARMLPASGIPVYTYIHTPHNVNVFDFLSTSLSHYCIPPPSQVRLGGARRAEPRSARGGRAGLWGACRVGEALRRRVERAHRRPARCALRIHTRRLLLLHSSAARVVHVLRALAQWAHLRDRHRRRSRCCTRYDVSIIEHFSGVIAVQAATTNLRNHTHYCIRRVCLYSHNCPLVKVIFRHLILNILKV